MGGGGWVNTHLHRDALDDLPGDLHDVLDDLVHGLRNLREMYEREI